MYRRTVPPKPKVKVNVFARLGCLGAVVVIIVLAAMLVGAIVAALTYLLIWLIQLIIGAL